ncbi:MAG: hypothetical protein IJR58_05550 [Lachnospiraceae bacterium]|nr:hypothetical protein [Lachnospiraceae bacterium]
MEEREVRDRNEAYQNRRTAHRTRLAGRLLLLGIMLAILIIVVMLLVWNRGRETGFDINEVSTEFDTEELDQVFYVPEEDLATSQAATDVKLNILFLGNDALSDGDENARIPDYVASYLKEHSDEEVHVSNAAVAGSRIAAKSAQYDAMYPYDLVSFFYTASYIASGDFSFMERYATDTGSATASSAAQVLKETDFSALDMIVVMYDATDYLNGTPVFNPGNAYDQITYCGALKSGIMAIKERYPHIRFVFMFPTFCYIEDADGNLGNSDIVDIGNGDLTTYLIKAIDVCQEEGVSIIDNYSGTVNEDNADEYLTDNVHLTDTARKHIAAHLLRVVFPQE